MQCILIVCCSNAMCSNVVVQLFALHRAGAAHYSNALCSDTYCVVPMDCVLIVSNPNTLVYRTALCSNCVSFYIVIF